MNQLMHALLAAVVVLMVRAPLARAAEPIRVLIVDGRNNHDWRNTTASLAATLKATGRFAVDISTAPIAYPTPMPPRPKASDVAAQPAYDAAVKAWKAESAAYEKAHAGDWESWRPRFADYAVVVNDYNGPEWPQPVKDTFAAFVRGGGGVVNVHAANNGFPNWREFNEMIGIGWRGATFGQRVAVDDATGKLFVVPAEKDAAADGKEQGSSHGSKHPFIVKVRDAEHPICAGLPAEWMHGSDELYHRMRGSPDGVHVLASAFSEVKQRGTGMHEPMLWWVAFGQGRVVTTSMGHRWPGDTRSDALQCVGFQTVFARSVEWAATGRVTLPIPEGFPSAERESLVPPEQVKWAR